MTSEDRAVPTDAELTVRTKPPTGAVLSVRVPRDLAIAVDRLATARNQSLSETVREALDQFVMASSVQQAPTLYASTNAMTNLVLSSADAHRPQGNRGAAQTETLPRELAIPA
jgi:hypothetical protein